MFSLYTQQGADAALSAYGLIKLSRLRTLALRSLLQSVRGLRNLDARSIGSSLKQMAVGQPSKYVDQLQKNKLHKPGGLLRESVVPQGSVQALLMYGLPALSLYGASQAPAEQRGSALGSTIGLNIGGTLGQPLGMIGSMAGSMLGGALGQSVGGVFDKKVPDDRFASGPPVG